MKIYCIVLIFCYFLRRTSAGINGTAFLSAKCMSVSSVTSNVTAVTLSQCAAWCQIKGQEAFFYDFKNGECRVVIEDLNVSPTCPVSSDHRYFKIKKSSTVKIESTTVPIGPESTTVQIGPDECPVPIPPGYGLEYPVNGDTTLAKFICITFTDDPPFDSCPVVKCAGPYDYSDKPVSCSVKDVFNSSAVGIGDYEYEGGVTCTVQGVVCQRWDTDNPHGHDIYDDRSDFGNRCKYADEHRPWCYTIDPKVRYDFCPVEELNCGDPPNPPSPPGAVGRSPTTEWPHLFSRGLFWYQCASFMGNNPVQHCPVAMCQGDLSWSEATISCSADDCYNSNSYTGRVSCTETGNTCQRWDSDYPNSHSILSGRSDLENWCQIDGESRPWCYTTSLHVRWDFCSVKKC